MARTRDDHPPPVRPSHSEEIYQSLVGKSFDAIVVLQDGKILFANPQAARLVGYTHEEAQRMEFASRPNAYLSVVPPELRSDLQRGVEAALSGEDTRQQVEYRLIDKTGKIVNVEARFKPIEYRGYPALLLVLRDITERKRAEIVERITKELFSSANLDFILSSTVERCRRLLHGGLAYLTLRDDKAGTLTLKAVSGEANEELKRITLGPGTGLTGCVLETGQIINVGNYPDSEAFHHDASVDAILAKIGARSAVAAPLTVGTRIIGALAVFSPREAPFSTKDEEILQKLADCAAAAIGNARPSSKTDWMSFGGAALLELSTAITSTLDLTELLRIITTKTATACRADRCSIIRWTEDGRLDPLMSQFASGLRDSQLWLAFKKLDRYRVEDIPAFTHVVDQRDPVVIDNPEGSSLLPRDWVEVFRLKSVLVVPLVRQDRVVGVLHLDNTHERRPFDAEQIQLASTIANLVVLAIENAHLFRETERRLQESEMLLGVSRSMSSTLDLTELIRRVAREATRALGANSAAAYRCDPNLNVLHPLAAYHLPTELRLAMREVPVAASGFAFLEQAWRTKQAVFSNDTSRDARCDSPLLRQFPQKSTLFVPMVVKEEIIGGLFLFWWHREHRFSPQELALVDAIARQAGMALENARLYAQLKRSNTDLERSKRTVEELYRLSVALQESLDPSLRLDLILRGAHEVAGLDRILLFLADPETHYLQAVASVGDVDEPLDRVRVPLDARGGALAKAFLEGRAIRIDGPEALPPDLRLAPPCADIKWLRSCSFLVLPLISRNRPIGVLALDNKPTRRPLPENIELLQIFANHAATAIENARLYENERTAKEESVKRAAELAALIKGNTLITSRLNLDQVLDGIVTVAAELTRLPHWIVMLANEEAELVWKTMIQIPEEVQKIGRLEIGESLSGLVAQNRELIIVEDMACDPRFRFPYLATKYGFKAYLGIPMRAKDKLVGVLATFTKRPHRFTEGEINLLTAFADQAAIAIENAQLYSKVKELAIHRERNRLARTLHDSLTQTLFSAGLNLDWCLHRLSGNQEVIRRIRTAKQHVGSVMAQVRDLIHEFSKEEDTLRKADPHTILRSVVADFQRLSGIKVELRLRGAFAGLDSEISTVVYRCVQEALVNVAKHSQAKTARVSVEILDGRLRFRVQDDGIGRADELVSRVQTNESCFGLRQMHERLAEVGGSLRIEDNTPAGLRLIGTLPTRALTPEDAR